jgi:hypothetical protein
MNISIELGNWPSEFELLNYDYLEAEFEEDLRSIATETWIFNSVAAFMDDPRFSLLEGDGHVFESRSFDVDDNLLDVCLHVHHQLMYMGNVLGDAIVNILGDHVSVEFNWDTEAVLTA